MKFFIKNFQKPLTKLKIYVIINTTNKEKELITMENILSALEIKTLLEELEHLNEETKSKESEAQNAEPALDLYKDDIYLYGLVKERGGEKVLEDFLNKIADEYGLEAEPTVYASKLIKLHSNAEKNWNSVSRIIHCVLNYIEDYNKWADEDEEDESADEESDECKCKCECGKCRCGSKCECGNNECKNCETTAKSGNIQTITFTTKSGQVLGCCTDEDITSIKVVSSNGKMSIFNL